MIVSMVKMTVVTTAGRAEDALEGLRDLGLLHVSHVKPPESDALEAVKAEEMRLDRALSLLPETEASQASNQSADAMEVAGEIISTGEAMDDLSKRRREMLLESERLAPLGDFSPDDISFLESRGLSFRLFRCQAGDLARTPVPVPHVVLRGKGDLRYVACASGKEFSLPFEELRVPAESLSELIRKAGQITAEIARLEERLEDLSRFRSLLVETREDMARRAEFQKVLDGMGEDGPLCYVQGYCPERDSGVVAAEASRRGWAVIRESPADDDSVPTLIENNRLIRIIEPVMKLMGTVPGYREYDISFLFLVSLGLFFAMLVGDGGYGLLFLAGAAAARKMYPSAPREPFLLVGVMGAATVIWGFLTGTWFGVEAMARAPVLGRFVVPALDSYRSEGEFMMQLCFVLGAAHLSIAHMLRGLGGGTLRGMISQGGWICLVWCIYLIAGTLVLGRPLSPAVPYLLFTGVFAVVFFGGHRKDGWVRSVISGIADMPLAIVRAFSDLVSYIRLFAVGYATLVVAVSFNSMAFNLKDSGIAGFFAAMLVVVLGHGMNLALASMGVLVHGIRLNMLEFSSHLGMEWSGTRYRPFS